MKTMRLTLSALLTVVVSTLFIACDDSKPRSSKMESDSIGELVPATQKPAEQPPPPAEASEPVITNQAVISTDLGDITVGLYGFDAPKTVQNFIGLSKKDFYDGIGFHRIVPGFVIQGGDPNSKDPTRYKEWGQGGESIYGGTFEDELDPNSPSGKIGYAPGVLAMANRGPNTNTSQFFIVLTEDGARRFQYAYTIFGKVLSGMDVVQKIVGAAVDNNGNPIEIPPNPVRIKDVVVKDAEPSIK